MGWAILVRHGKTAPLGVFGIHSEPEHAREIVATASPGNVVGMGQQHTQCSHMHAALKIACRRGKREMARVHAAVPHLRAGAGWRNQAEARRSHVHARKGVENNSRARMGGRKEPHDPHVNASAVVPLRALRLPAPSPSEQGQGKEIMAKESAALTRACKATRACNAMGEREVEESQNPPAATPPSVERISQQAPATE